MCSKFTWQQLVALRHADMIITLCHKSAGAVWCRHDNMDQNLWAMIKRIISEGKTQPGTSKVYF